MRTWPIATLPISQIDVDPLDPSERTIDEEACRNLACSIESDGLIHPLLVRPQGGGRYRLIAGRHRLRAVHEYLRWPEVDCKIADDVDDEMARSMALAENLWVLPLDGLQLEKALRRWWEIYHRRHPGAEGRGSHMKRGRGEPAQGAASLHPSAPGHEEPRSGEAENARRGEDAEPRDRPSDGGFRSEQQAMPFYRAIQGALGVSSPTAQRLSRVARKLTSEQMDVLGNHGVGRSDRHRLAGLGDEKAIQSAIDLIGAGRDAREVVRSALKLTKIEEQARPRGAATSTGAEGPKATAIMEPSKPSEPTDEEWLAQHCGPILERLERKGPFRRDAILYRRLAHVLPGFRRGAKKALKEARHPDGNGGFFGAVSRVTRAAHPGDWYVCGACDGAGSVTAPGAGGPVSRQRCWRCGGGAYILKIED